MVYDEGIIINTFLTGKFTHELMDFSNVFSSFVSYISLNISHDFMVWKTEKKCQEEAFY